MLDNKKIKEIENRMKQFISEGIVKSKEESKNTEFFLENSYNSLQSAKLLLDVSLDLNLQEKTGYLKFNGYLWVVNASYYSMFYMVRALLEHFGIKLKSDLSIHSLVFDSFVYYFYLNFKLQKYLIDIFIEVKDDAVQILGKEIAEELIENYFHEKQKRAKLTYETGKLALQNKAKTSFERAEQFNREIRKIIVKK
jgi:uncharacterized protein (UPF0332 family)